MNNDQMELNQEILELDDAAIENVSGANVSAVVGAVRRAAPRQRGPRTTPRYVGTNNRRANSNSR